MKKNIIAKKNNESLQKFTDFEKIKSSEIAEFKAEVGEIEFRKYLDWLQDKLNTALKRDKPLNDYEIDKYWNRAEKIMDIIYKDYPEHIENNKRERWNFNESKIKNFIHNTMVNKRYVPNNSEISEATGLSRVTISKHIKENSLSVFKQEERDKYRMLNSTALNQLYYLAFHNGDVKALKMFIELTKEPEECSKVVNNNFIQINNTKIDNLLIEQLPVKIRLQIERIILKNLPK